MARRELLAVEANRRMEDLLHGDTRWLGGADRPVEKPKPIVVMGGFASEDEERKLADLNDWVASLSLPRGHMAYDLTDPDTGEQRAVLDLAWPDGLQEGLSQSVAVLLNEGSKKGFI